MPRRRNRSGKDDSRRNFLKASGAGAVALSLAGCSTQNNNDDEGENTSTTSTGSTTTEAAGTVEVGPDNITPGGTLRYGLPSNPDSPNIFLSGSVYSAVALSPIYNYGITTDPVTFEVKENVFTDWEVKNADKEKPDIYFNVRKEGLEWNDGEKFKPIEDVLFSYQYVLDNEPGEYSVWNDFDAIEEASNDWDLHIKMSKQVGTWDSTILGGAPIIPKHKWEGVDYKNYDPMKENDEGPVGTGPGKLTKYNPDTSMQVKFRRDYIDNTYALNSLQWIKDHKSLVHGGPFLDGVNFKVYGGTGPMTQAFLNGDIDTHYGSFKASKIPKVQKSEDKGLMKGYDSGFSYYGFNCRRAPLDDVALRQAMAFLFDDKYWTQTLKGGFVIKGDYAHSPGYRAARPESVHDGNLLTDPQTNAFDFRSAGGKKPDIEGVRKFLTDGNVVSGKGTYVGKEFPGTYSGVKASRSSSKYEYTFGSVKSKALKNSNADKELLVDGKTIPEMMDGDSLTIFIDPPSEKPNEAKAIAQWVKNLKQLGIPVSTKPIEFNTMTGKVYQTEEFDIYPMGWGGTDPYGTSIEAFFHSRQSGDDHEKFAYNSTGYGVSGGSADKLIDTAYSETEPEPRNKKWAKAIERVYLDMPYMVQDYAKYRWPMNTAKFGGVVENIVDPAYANWGVEYGNMYLKKNLKK
ncbi:ABC transporter substrate-binding protein [Haladaptatus sp. NG-SE-30]